MCAQSKMLNRMWLIILIFVLTGMCRNGSTCSIGDGSEVGDIREPVSGFFYLDLINTALCDSFSVSRIKYCYHNSPTLSQNIVEAQVAIYRRANTVYSNISDVFIVTNNMSASISSGLVCEYLHLETPIEVEAGDMIGVCFPSVGESEPLPMMSHFTGGTLSASSCGAGPVDSSSSRFRFPVNDVKLHLHAESDPGDDGNTETTTRGTSAPSLSGTEVNTELAPESTPLTSERESQSTPLPVDLSTNSFKGGSIITESEAQTDTITTDESIMNSVGELSEDEQNDNMIDIVVGVVVGVALALLVLAGGITAVVVVVAMATKKKRILLFSKPSIPTTNGYATNSTIDRAVYDYIDEEGNSPQKTGEEKRNEAAIEEGAVYKTPDYVNTQQSTLPCNHRNSEGYYIPMFPETVQIEVDTPADAPMYSDLIPPEDTDEDTVLYETPASEENELYAQLRIYQITKINFNELETREHLGSGQFGSVDSGVWKNEKEVALKTLKKGLDTDYIKLLQEAVIMVQFQHKNVLNLYGVARSDEAIILVTELAHKGDLKEYLLSMKLDNIVPTADLPHLLLTFSYQIALGMHYLASKGFVHRDLAARNILVTSENICKVADFGMSRDLFDGTYYVSTGGKVPLKWTAPESLHYNKYSTASDVWSYGCVLYEIWSLGTKPFSRIKNEKFIGFIDAGNRLCPPPGCPRVIYHIMIACWNPGSALRPSFQDILCYLLRDRKQVLEIPVDAQQSHPQASQLGGALEAGSAMYQDLRMQYSQSEVDDKQS